MDLVYQATMSIGLQGCGSRYRSVFSNGLHIAFSFSLTLPIYHTSLPLSAAHLSLSTARHTKYSKAIELSTYSQIDFDDLHQTNNSSSYMTLSTETRPKMDGQDFPEQDEVINLDRHLP